MMLSELLNNIADVSASRDCEVSSVTIDSQEVLSGSLFIALKGTQQHGLDYVQEVVDQGAVAIIWESDANVQFPSASILQIEIKNLRQHLGEIANRFFHSPSETLKVIGITGTDGKTSVSHFIAQSLNRCAVMGTLGIGALDQLEKATHTTPDVINTHRNIAQMKSKSLEAVAMEVSSHALDQGRVAGVDFDVAVLTNLTRDHLDYHGTVKAYAEAKTKLFDWPDLKGLVLNLDDAFGRKIASRDYAVTMKERSDADPKGEMKSSQKWGGVFLKDFDNNKLKLIGYGVGNINDYPENTLIAQNVRFDSAGIKADIHFGDQQALLHATVLGRFNLSNLLAALGAMLVLDVSLEDAIAKLSKVETVAGRMEKVSDTEVLAVVDYAHTPNALETVLKALREHTQNKLICVFGCGGDRDSGKRPIMAKIAESNADVVIVTDDNPRTENPETIMQDIVAGFENKKSITVEHDRATAISKALKTAVTGDTVLIAGKGHENVQILATGSIPFSDREHANKVLQELAA